MKKCQLDKQDDTTKAHQQSDQLSHDFAHLKKHKFLVSFRKHERKLFLERAILLQGAITNLHEYSPFPHKAL